MEKCQSVFCFVTGHDVNIEWVQCNECDQWYHTMCKALTPREELALSEEAGVSNLGVQFQLKMSSLIEEEELNQAYISAKICSNNLKAQYTEVMGGREKQLNEASSSK